MPRRNHISQGSSADNHNQRSGVSASTALSLNPGDTTCHTCAPLRAAIAAAQRRRGFEETDSLAADKALPCMCDLKQNPSGVDIQRLREVLGSNYSENRNPGEREFSPSFEILDQAAIAGMNRRARDVTQNSPRMVGGGIRDDTASKTAMDREDTISNESEGASHKQTFDAVGSSRNDLTTRNETSEYSNSARNKTGGLKRASSTMEEATKRDGPNNKRMMIGSARVQISQVPLGGGMSNQNPSARSENRIDSMDILCLAAFHVEIEANGSHAPLAHQSPERHGRDRSMVQPGRQRRRQHHYATRSASQSSVPVGAAKQDSPTKRITIRLNLSSRADAKGTSEHSLPTPFSRRRTPTADSPPLEAEPSTGHVGPTSQAVHPERLVATAEGTHREIKQPSSVPSDRPRMSIGSLLQADKVEGENGITIADRDQTSKVAALDCRLSIGVVPTNSGAKSQQLD
ncbi:MAG: hypothetical protein M1818_004065 [Claussenomyces sp. TS43310]|nr:MAG: hypothetical protein M1818_004065 [Claussenomyces sp. TS43310]